MKKLIVSLLALVAISAAFAIPSMFGATGGIITVSANPTERPIVASYFYNSESGFVFPQISAALPIEALPGLELSGMYMSDNNTTWTIGAKYALPIDVIENTKIAVGGFIGKDDFNVAYLAGTYNVAEIDMRVTGNVLYSFEAKDFYYSANLEKDFDKTTVGLEYSNTAKVVNGYAKTEVYTNLDAVVGAVGMKTGDSVTWVGGLTYTF